MLTSARLRGAALTLASVFVLAGCGTTSDAEVADQAGPTEDRRGGRHRARGG